MVKGWTSEKLLESYTAERHPIGEWALEWTRAQVALMRPEPHARAMGEITKELIGTPQGATYFAKKISGVWQRYDCGPGHALLGSSAPDLEFRDGSRLGAHLQAGRAVVFRLDGKRAPQWRSGNGIAWCRRSACRIPRRAYCSCGRMGLSLGLGSEMKMGLMRRLRSGLARRSNTETNACPKRIVKS